MWDVFGQHGSAFGMGWLWKLSVVVQVVVKAALYLGQLSAAATIHVAAYSLQPTAAAVAL